MKKCIITLSVVLLILSSVKAQENNASVSIGMKDEFSEMSKFARSQSGFENIQTYSSGAVKGSQFYYPTWVSGSVVTSNNETISDKYVFLFDRVRQELFIKLKDSNMILLGDKTQILSFTLNTDKQHLFVADTKYNKLVHSISFYEVMEKSDIGYSFFKFVNTKFVKADPYDMVKVKNGDMSDEFVDNTTYYLYSPATGLNKIAFNQKNILKGLETSKQEDARLFFSEHKSDKIDEVLVIGLVKRLNKS